MPDKLKLDDLGPSSFDPLSIEVGETVRAGHGMCKMGNTTVTRTPVGWVMHCFQCGAKGFSYARVASLPAVAISEGLRSTKPLNLTTAKGAISTLELSKLRLSEWEIDRFDIKYCKTSHRLAFRTSSVVPNGTCFSINPSGYALRNLSTVPGSLKWISLRPATPTDTAYVYYPYQNDKTPFKWIRTDAPIVLCEDPISALKIHVAGKGNYIAMAMLGLNIAPTLLEWAVQLDSPVILWVDGDGAGISRGVKLLDQLKFLRYNKQTALTYVPGLDPKHLGLIQIRKHLDTIHQTLGDGSSSVEAVSPAHT